MSNITYSLLANGTWACRCVFQDLCTKHVVGWQVRADMAEVLVISTLKRTLLAQRPAPGLIVHSDRGDQCASNVYKVSCHGTQAQRSHSRRGDCYSNAQAESRWSRLKTEELEAQDGPVFADLVDAQASVADYFDYDNHERHQSSIGSMKPY